MSDGNPIAGLKDTQADITRKASVVVRALELALAGHEPRDIAQTPGAGGNHTTAVLVAHGYPSTKAMAANIRALKPLGDLPVTFDTPTTKGPAMTTPEPLSIEALLRLGETHDQPRIAKKAERIRALIDDLETAIEADKADAERRAKITKLEAELAALKPPRKQRTRSNRLTKGVYPCDGCDRVLDTPQGLSAHRRRAHEGWNPQTGQAAS